MAHSDTDDRLPYDATGKVDAAQPQQTWPGAFAKDTVVGGRYRVVRFIASGGMGEVYEAEDLELGERIALKILHARSGSDRSGERFKREIQLARKAAAALGRSRDEQYR